MASVVGSSKSRKDAPDANGRPALRKPFTPRPNFSKIHAKPLPVDVHPLPAFIPHNPISILRVVYVLVCHYAFPPSSHPKVVYHATFSSETTSVFVTDQNSIRALWESGFFGKGSLSRSEPNWLAQERKRLGLDGGLTSEMYTQQRRQERIDMKNERARLQREAVEEQLKAEQAAQEAKLSSEYRPAGGLAEPHSNDNMLSTSPETAYSPVPQSGEDKSGPTIQTDALRLPVSDSLGSRGAPVPGDLELQSSETEEHELHITDQEHLQLSLEEAFFLVYALGILQVDIGEEASVNKAADLLHLFRRSSYFPPKPANALGPDDPFLVNYVVYHHFRSLGWVIRPGNKFSVDYLLYKGGPVFSHAEFAVAIVPSYVDEWWFAVPERRAAVNAKRKEQQWWWVQNTNRVQTQVLKTLVLAYVEVPPPGRIDVLAEQGDVGALLKQYRVREFVMKRWTPNRQRE